MEEKGGGREKRGAGTGSILDTGRVRRRGEGEKSGYRKGRGGEGDMRKERV